MTNAALQSLQKLLLCQSLFYDIPMHCTLDVDSLLPDGSSAESRRSSLSQTRGEEYLILASVILSCRSTSSDLGRLSRPQLTLCKGSSRSAKVDCLHCNTCELTVTRTNRCVSLYVDLSINLFFHMAQFRRGLRLPCLLSDDSSASFVRVRTASDPRHRRSEPAQIFRLW